MKNKHIQGRIVFSLTAFVPINPNMYANVIANKHSYKGGFDYQNHFVSVISNLLLLFSKAFLVA